MYLISKLVWKTFIFNGFEEILQILISAKFVVNIVMVCDIISHVLSTVLVDWRKPDAVKA